MKAGKKRQGGGWLARVSVGLKPEVLDPQGKTVMSALHSLGFRGLVGVRIGKHFWINISGKVSREAAARSVSRMAEMLLVNPVIEHYTFTLNRSGKNGKR